MIIHLRECFFCLVLAFSSLAADSLAAELPPVSGVVPASYFGIHLHRGHDKKLIPSLPYGAFRLWDAGVSWVEVEPSEGQFNFSRLDLLLGIAEKKGMEVLYTAGRTPSWAAKNPTASSFYREGQSSPPVSNHQFQNYLRAIATRYKGRIKHYEVWNEPASGKMFSGTIPEMVSLTAAAAQAIKAVDSDAKIICPSPAKFESLRWFEEFLTKGGGLHCDVIGYHFYTDSPYPEEKLRLIKAVQAIVRASPSPNIEIWDTESGFALHIQEPPLIFGSLEAHLSRWLLVNWASGIKRFYWYSWDHGKLGFVNPIDASLRNPQANIAFEVVRGWMLGAEFLGCTERSKVWQCTLRLKNGELGDVYWAESIDAVQVVEVKGAHEVFDISGTSCQSEGSASITVKPEPVLVVSYRQK